MSFNTSTFNQNGFNLTSYKGLELFVDEVINIDCVCKAFDNLYFAIDEKIIFNAECNVSQGRLIECHGNEAFDCESELKLAYIFDENFNEEFKSEINFSYDLFLLVDENIKIQSESNLNSKISLNVSSSINITSTCQAFKKINFDIEMIVYFDAIIDVENVEERILSINVSIPPGKKLVIDARNYTAYLDNVNVLDKITGVWPDEIERETNAILITCSNSNSLKTTMLYDELYL